MVAPLVELHRRTRLDSQIIILRVPVSRSVKGPTPLLCMSASLLRARVAGDEAECALPPGSTGRISGLAEIFLRRRKFPIGRVWKSPPIELLLSTLQNERYSTVAAPAWQLRNSLTPGIRRLVVVQVFHVSSSRHTRTKSRFLVDAQYVWGLGHCYCSGILRSSLQQLGGAEDAQS